VRVACVVLRINLAFGDHRSGWASDTEVTDKGDGRMILSTYRLFSLTALVEVVTGIGLVVVPPFVLRLVWGAAADALGLQVAQLAGIALISIGLLCWFSRSATDPRPGLATLLVYNGLVALFFLYVGVSGHGGVLLWPVVVAHGILTVLYLQALRSR
jgi:hypothetical protein